MSFDAGSITAKIGIDVSPFAKGMLQAKEISSEFPEVVSAYIAEPILGVIETLKEGTEEVKSFFEMVGDTAREMNELGEMAEKAGVSVEFLSGTGKAFENAGSSVEGLSESLKFLNKAMGEVVMMAPGSERTAMIFQKLGISYDFLRSHMNDTQSVFYKVADGVSSLGSNAERTSVLIELLSRGGADAVSAFAKGSKGLKDFADETARLGGTVNQKQAEMSHSFVTLSSYVQSAIEGMKKAASEPILDALQNHFGEVQKGVEELEDWAGPKLTAAITGVVDYVSSHKEEIKGDLKEIGTTISDWLPTLQEVMQTAHEAVSYISAANDLLHPEEAAKRAAAAYSGMQVNPDDVVKAGGAGVSGLQVAAKDLATAQAPLLDVLKKVQTIDWGGENGRDDSWSDQGGKDQEAILTASNSLKNAMTAMGSGNAGPAAVSEATDKLKALADAIDVAKRHIGDWTEARNQIGGDQRGPIMQSALDQSRADEAKAAQAIRAIADAAHQSGGASLPVTGTANAGSAPGATNTVPSASTASALGTSLAPAATLSAATLQSMAAQGNSTTQMFQTMSNSLSQLNPQLATLITATSAPAGSFSSSTTASGSGSAAGAVTINGGINVPPLDVHDASSQIAAKLVPVIRAVADQQKRQLDAAAHSLATQGGL